MAYVKNIWVDQDVERPKTYEVTNNQDGSITLTDSFGIVTELGTPVNEVNMNHIEDGIDGCAIRKHNLTETFNLGEWVLGGTGDDEGIYKSLVANNVGNAISDDTKWEKVEMGGGSSRNIGEIVQSTIPLVDAGLHLLDGALIDGNGIYSDFVDYIAGLVTDYPDLFETEANWQSAVTTYGYCNKFVYNSVNNTVRLPKFPTKYIVDVNDSKVLTGNEFSVIGNPSLRIANVDGSSIGGALFLCHASGDNRVYHAQVDDNGYPKWGSNYIAPSNLYADIKNSTEGIDVYYYIVVATITKTEIQVDIDEIATDLNGKADVDLTNVNDTGYIKMAGASMPSDTYEDLTLGASGSTYTAPANGWFLFMGFLTNPNGNVGAFLFNNSKDYGVGGVQHNQGNKEVRILLPVTKNDVIQIGYQYSSTYASSTFRFIYAQGSESEAS